MGNGRFLYNNLITDESMLAVSSLRSGVVTSALKAGAGSAVLNPSGAYSGSVDKEFIVEIDSIAAGAEVGSATFKWSDGGGSWNATGITTLATNILLNNGVYVNFTSGSGADFVVGDKWYFKGINFFNVGKMLDLDRDSRYRSAALGSPNTITIDLGSPQEIKSLILYDHNLTSGATIVLKGNTSDAWGAPAFSEAITWSDKHILHYLSAAQTYRYWQIQITDAANPDGFVEIGELFLGSYLELSENYVTGFEQTINLLVDSNVTPYGVERDRFYNEQSTFQFSYNLMPAADVTSMKALIAAIASRATGMFKPFWLNRDSAAPDESWMVKPRALPIKHRMFAYYDMPLEFIEVVKSV